MNLALVIIKNKHRIIINGWNYSMYAKNSGKKNIFAASLTVAIVVSGSHNIAAEPCDKNDSATFCPVPSTAMNEATNKQRKKFISETRAARKNLAEKQAVKLIIRQNNKPDTEQIAKLTEEIFELREQVIIQAMEAGLPLHIAKEIMDKKTTVPKICAKRQQGKE